MDMDWSYSREPIIMGRFIHLDYFLKYHWDKKVINLEATEDALKYCLTKLI
jgi:hypothetical protein